MKDFIYRYLYLMLLFGWGGCLWISTLYISKGGRRYLHAGAVGTPEDIFIISQKKEFTNHFVIIIIIIIMGNNLKCKRCDNEWVSIKKEGVVKSCPRCKSYSWDIERPDKKDFLGSISDDGRFKCKSCKWIWSPKVKGTIPNVCAKCHTKYWMFGGYKGYINTI